VHLRRELLLEPGHGVDSTHAAGHSSDVPQASSCSAPRAQPLDLEPHPSDEREHRRNRTPPALTWPRARAR
jgi:hypothetical protein